MIWWRDFLASHRLVLALLHGQAFFVLGLSILFLTRRAIRLQLARDLTPLAALGLCEAGFAWSGAWLEVSAASPSWLVWLRLIALVLGYALLFSFALHVSSAVKRGEGRWLIGGTIVLVWGLGLLLLSFSRLPISQVRLVGEIVARYGLALPGGLLGAWGLRQEMYRTIEPGRLPMVKWPLRITEVALAAFGMFGGMVGPAAPFFPASFLNEELLLAWTGVPISLFRGLAGVGITFGVVRALSAVLNEVDIWLENVERMHALVDERERIGRELHDGIIQSIYASGLILEGARQSVTKDPERARQQLTSAIENLNGTIQDIRRYIFDLRGEMPQDDLRTGLRKMLKDFRVNTLLETQFSVHGDGIRRFDAERRQHIFQIVREALTNVARHAYAREVEINLEYGANALQLTISDDGVGLSALPSDNGHGLRNIRERTRLVNGMLDIDTAPNEGLTLVLTVPYQQRVASSPSEAHRMGN